MIGAELAGEAVIKVLIEAWRRVAREMEPRVLATGAAAGRGLLRIPVMVVRPVGQGRGQEIGQGQRPPGVPGAGVHGDDLRQQRDPVRDHGSELINLLPLTAIKDRKSYAASVKGFASSIWHFAMTFATDFEVQLNG